MVLTTTCRVQLGRWIHLPFDRSSSYLVSSKWKPGFAGLTSPPTGRSFVSSARPSSRLLCLLAYRPFGLKPQTISSHEGFSPRGKCLSTMSAMAPTSDQPAAQEDAAKNERKTDPTTNPTTTETPSGNSGLARGPAKARPRPDNDDEADHNPGGNEKKSKRQRREIKRDHTRRSDYSEEGNPKELHTGSYANPAQRALFQVQLEPNLLAALDRAEREAAAATFSQGGDDVEAEDDVNDHAASNEGAGSAKRVKRKVVFLLGYLGTNYGGFQMNEGQRSLQVEFELALLRASFITARNFGYPHKYGWSTSGRTDKGVHACAQVCSAKIEVLPDQTMDQVREELNQFLPDDLRVLDVVRTTRNFCARTQRDRVRYQYMIPSFLFADVTSVRDLMEKAGIPNNGRLAADPMSRDEVALIRDALRTVRATPEHLKRLQGALTMYQGTHPFHNFTRGVRPDEPRANRYIISFQTEQPVVFKNGMEWIPTQVVGQSFLIHQIRKMVSVAIDIARGVIPPDTIERAFSKDVAMRVMPAPAQGLFMEMAFYRGYNRRKNQNQDLHDLDWSDESKPVFERWKDFRNTVLMNHIVDEEENEGNFIKFLFIQEFVHDRRRFLNLDGYEEDEAVADSSTAAEVN